MHHASNNVYEKEFEELLMAPLSPRYEEKRRPTVQNKPRRESIKAKAIRGRTQSVQSFGNHLKQRQVFMTSPILQERMESLESELSDTIEHNNTQTIPKHAKPRNGIKTLNTMLLEALKYREVEEIEKLIIAGANPNATCCIECISACHLAALRPDGALAMLLSHGADKNRFDKTGRTPLHIAAWAGNLRQIAMLLGFSKDLTNKVSCTKMTPALAEEVKDLSQFLKETVNAKCSMDTPQINVAQEWMDNVADHNCKEFEKSLPLFQPGWTPLHAASSRAKSHCVNLLLAAGADPSIRDLVGRTALDLAGSTYYADEYVDPDSFAETVAALAKEKSNFSVRNRKILDTPLHTAVELNSILAVKTLLSVDAPIGWLNRAGLSPVHISVKKMLPEIFKMFVNYRPEVENEMSFKKAIDLRDKDGHTILHAAVLENWMYGVCIAIDGGANIMAKDNKGDTPLHLAAVTGNIDILNKLLNSTTRLNDINCVNAQSETPLIIAVINRNTECVKRLLEAKAAIKAALPYQINVFHLAASKGYEDVLQTLLDFDYNISKGMINYLADDKDGFGPIHYAVYNNHPNCVKLLLSRNAFRSLATSVTGIHSGSTPLHIAAYSNNVEIGKILIKNNPDTVHNVNSQDWTPLHTACNHGSRDMIQLLLKEGADLSAQAIFGKTRITAIELLVNSLSGPTEFLTNIFDSCISTNDSNIQDPNCEVAVDYQILIPIAESKEQLKVIDAIIQTGDRYEQRSLLIHPLIESFLHLKWKALLPFFYTMILVYGLYVAILTLYVFSEFYYKDNKNVPKPEWVDSNALGIGVYVTSFFVVALEALYINFSFKYFFQAETWIKFGAMLLALNLPNAIVSLSGERLEYARHIATIALLMSWLEMMFLLSRFPKWGYYVLMFGKVSSNVLKILFTFSFLVIGFSLGFMVQFHHLEPFENPISALVKTIVMLGSEFDYGDLVEIKTSNNMVKDTDNLTTEETISLVMFRLIFLSFLILASIVLMNLMVGVAVNDLHNLQVLGNIRRLTKQVELLVSLDTLLYNRYFREILPKSLERILLKKKTIEETIHIRPSDPNSRYYKALPSEIRNTIFEKAQLRKKKMEDERGILSYRRKLDEIYDAVIAKNGENEDSFEAAKQLYSHELSSGSIQNISQKISELDSGIIDSNKQTSENLRDIKIALKQLDIKLDVIFKMLQNFSNTEGKGYKSIYKRDK